MKEHQSLKILSYNIQVGITTQHYRQYLTSSWKHILPYPSRMKALRQIGGFISDFDLVGLQELDAGSLRSSFIDQAAFLARMSGFTYWHSMVNRKIGPLARHAMGFLSRIPPVRIVEHRLPSRIPGRGALEIHFGSGPDPLVVILLHSSLGKRARHMQFNYVRRLTDRYQYVLLMGDLNCQPDSNEFSTLIDGGALRLAPCAACTYPSWAPARAFDHILASQDLEIIEARVYPMEISDHLPVGVEILLPPHLQIGHPPGLMSDFQTKQLSTKSR